MSHNRDLTIFFTMISHELPEIFEIYKNHNIKFIYNFTRDSRNNHKYMREEVSKIIEIMKTTKINIIIYYPLKSLSGNTDETFLMLKEWLDEYNIYYYSYKNEKRQGSKKIAVSSHEEIINKLFM